MNGRFPEKNEKSSTVEEENEKGMEHKLNFSDGHRCVSQKHVSHRKITVISDLVGLRILDWSRINEIREGNENIEQKELYDLYYLLLFKPFRCRQ